MHLYQGTQKQYCVLRMDTMLISSITDSVNFVEILSARLSCQGQCAAGINKCFMGPWGVAQVLKHLPSKPETIISNPSAAK
jgi:hypothetical protein